MKLVLRTNSFKKIEMKHIIIIISTLLLYSCDPGYDESISIINSTGEDFIFVMDIDKNSNLDTFTLFLANRNLTNTRFTDPRDQSLRVHYNLSTGKTIVLHTQGGSGDANINSAQDGINLLNRHFDSLYLEDKILLKSLYQPNNYDTAIDDSGSLRNTSMTLIINTMDIE